MKKDMLDSALEVSFFATELGGLKHTTKRDSSSDTLKNNAKLDYISSGSLINGGSNMAASSVKKTGQQSMHSGEIFTGSADTDALIAALAAALCAVVIQLLYQLYCQRRTELHKKTVSTPAAATGKGTRPGKSLNDTSSGSSEQSGRNGDTSDSEYGLSYDQSLRRMLAKRVGNDITSPDGLQRGQRDHSDLTAHRDHFTDASRSGGDSSGGNPHLVLLSDVSGIEDPMYYFADEEVEHRPQQQSSVGNKGHHPGALATIALSRDDGHRSLRGGLGVVSYGADDSAPASTRLTSWDTGASEYFAEPRKAGLSGSVSANKLSRFAVAEIPPYRPPLPAVPVRRASSSAVLSAMPPPQVSLLSLIKNMVPFSAVRQLEPYAHLVDQNVDMFDELRTFEDRHQGDDDSVIVTGGMDSEEEVVVRGTHTASHRLLQMAYTMNALTATTHVTDDDDDDGDEDEEEVVVDEGNSVQSGRVSKLRPVAVAKPKSAFDYRILLEKEAAAAAKQQPCSSYHHSQSHVQQSAAATEGSTAMNAPRARADSEEQVLQSVVPFAQIDGAVLNGIPAIPPRATVACMQCLSAEPASSRQKDVSASGRREAQLSALRRHLVSLLERVRLLEETKRRQDKDPGDASTDIAAVRIECEALLSTLDQRAPPGEFADEGGEQPGLDIDGESDETVTNADEPASVGSEDIGHISSLNEELETLRAQCIRLYP